MKRVLVPVDGSDCSSRAVDYIIGDRAHYAAADGYEVHLLNVQAPLPRDVTQFVGHAQVADFHRAESERALQPAAAALADLLLGSIATRVIRLARVPVLLVKRRASVPVEHPGFP